MNTLFPIFVKLDQIQILLVGGGYVGLEKLSAMLRNSPKANITLVADTILSEVKTLASQHPQVQIFQRMFTPEDLENKQLVVVAVNDFLTSLQIKSEAEKRGILTNVADTPDLCDFYLAAVMQKEDLKIAISTNGKSPTFAKRMREWLEEMIGDDTQILLENLNEFRNQLKGDFQEKVKQLNELTVSMIKKKDV